MFQILKRNPLAAAIAISMHVAIILLMIFGLDWWDAPKPTKFKVDVVQARVVDAAKVDAEVKRLQMADKKKKEKENAALRKEQKKLDELRKKRKKEEKRIADLKKKRLAEQKAEKKRKADAKRKAVDKKKKAEAEKKRKAAEVKKRKEAEKKRKAEAKRKAEEKKRKAATEKKRKAEEARKRKLDAQRKAEAEMRTAMEAERDATEMERYQALIQEKVTGEWIRPIGVGDGLKCTLRIRMAAGGNVIAAEVVQGSGNGAFDRSARAAVLKADPLPVPSGRLFEKFRDIHFVFEPSEG